MTTLTMYPKAKIRRAGRLPLRHGACRQYEGEGADV